MTKIISDTTTLVTGKPGAQETVPPGEPADVDPKTAERLIARGQFRKYSPPGKKAAAEPSGGGSDEPVNVNEATVEQLTPIDGIGQEKAEAIVAYREHHGPFKSIEKTDDDPGLTPISGIADATAKKLAARLTV